MPTGTVTLNGKEVELEHVEPGYSTPKATKYLDTALKAEARGSEAMADKALDKAVEAEGRGE